MPSSDTSTERAAGGVVVRGDLVAVIVPVKRAADGSRVLGLPKGHLDGEETAELAAVREVREETGLEVELLDELGEVSYRYEHRGRRHHKTVRFYLFAYRGGCLADHDHEVERACWMPLSEAITALSYPGDREMVALARERIRSGTVG